MYVLICVHTASLCLVKSSVFSFRSDWRGCPWRIQELSHLGPPASPVLTHRDFPMSSSPYPTTCPAHSWVSNIASAGGGTSELPLAFSFTYDRKGSTWLPSIMGDLLLKAKTPAVVNQLPCSPLRCRGHKPMGGIPGEEGLLSIWATASAEMDVRTFSEYHR